MKRLSVMLLCAGCVLSFAACGKAAEKEADGNILVEMVEANADETIMAKHEKVAFITAYSYADGETVSEYYYRDADRYVMENEYWMYVDENGDVYGFDYEENVAFRNIFAGDSYQEFRAGEYLAAYEYDATEILTGQEEKDGHLILYTEDEDREFIREWAEIFLFEEENISRIVSVYEVDAESYEMYAVTTSVVLKDGEEKDIITTKRVENPETYVVEEELRDAVFGGDQRTVTLIENPGTEQEQAYTQTVSQEGVIEIYLPSDAKQELYLDEACTIIYDGQSGEEEEQTGDDVLYYIR